jgi:hypothetical protein
MPTEARKPRQKRKASDAILAAALLLTVMGCVTFYLLGREDPQDAAFSQLSWGDRVERRMDAFIDGVKPQWTERIERRMKGFADRIGWN